MALALRFHIIKSAAAVLLLCLLLFGNMKKLCSGEVHGKRNNRQLYLMEHDTTMHDLDI